MLAPRLVRTAGLLALQASLLAPAPARACSVCACGDPLAAVAETPFPFTRKRMDETGMGMDSPMSDLS
ncbi:MAG TPA: hypothetical protein VIV59_06045, partial [Anaeromyxobacteraceae bacterium]